MDAMPLLGSLALLLALVLAAFNLVVGAIAQRQLSTKSRGRFAPQRLAGGARIAGLWCFAAVSAAVAALLWAIFTNDFSVAYVVQESNRTLPAPYKLAALWSGQEGSLLLWAWMLSGFSFVVRFRDKSNARLNALASTILAGVEVFFLLLLNVVALPFAGTPGAPPADGFGLNPLLQNPEMVIHPPMLYLGYVGFSIPFAFVLAALMLRAPAEQWIGVTRRWSMLVWLFLTCGIVLGMHWAYAVLGWGGYWGWDPVENASLMPWLTGTALLHSMILQERRGMMKQWNVWLVFSTFLLCIVGTTLTRSGVVSSVHAFGKSPLGAWFLGFLIIVLLVCVVTYWKRRDYLETEHRVEGLVSRESSFLFLNLILVTACVTVFSGTLLPVFSEAMGGGKATVGAGFYNAAVVPIALLLLFLISTGPLLTARGTSLTETLKPFAVPGAIGVLTMVTLTLGGMHPWASRAVLYAWLCFSIAAFVTASIVTAVVRGLLAMRENTGLRLLPAAALLVRSNLRRYGAFTVHLGIALMFVGFAGTAFNHTVEKGLSPGQTMQAGPYQLSLSGLKEISNANYVAERAKLDVSRGNSKPFVLSPEVRLYQASQSRNTRVANHSTPLWDLYVVYEGNDPSSNLAVIEAILNPLVVWVWIGGIVMVLGSMLLVAEPLLKRQQAAKSRTTRKTAMAKS
ncbi:MAG: heme lyase CcmF/NrfE family subunit [Acidobacteriaceae bacterium]